MYPLDLSNLKTTQINTIPTINLRRFFHTIYDPTVNARKEG